MMNVICNSQVNVSSMHHPAAGAYGSPFLFFKEILFSINKFPYEWFCIRFSRLNIFCFPESHYSMELAQEKSP